MIIDEEKIRKRSSVKGAKWMVPSLRFEKKKIPNFPRSRNIQACNRRIGCAGYVLGNMRVDLHSHNRIFERGFNDSPKGRQAGKAGSNADNIQA